MTDPLGATTTVTRDHAGRTVQISDPLGATTRIEYTPEGRPAVRTGTDGSRAVWAYDGEGNLTTYTSPVGAVTQFEYTQFDLVSARIEPDGTRLSFAYDTELRLTQVTNPQGLTWTYTYDPAGRLIAETDFNDRVLRYSHDAAGRLIARTNGANQTTYLERDVMGHIIAKRTPEGTTRFAYDPAGRLLRATSPSADLAFTYDPAGNILTETVDGRTLTNTYDLAGQRTARVTPTGAASVWTYDTRHQPSTLTSAGHALHFLYDPAGHLTDQNLTTPGGWQTLRHTHDRAGRLSTQTLWFADTPTSPEISGGATAATPGSGAVRPRGAPQAIVHHGYVYRLDGHITATTDLAGRHRVLDLDLAGRITTVTAAGWTERYAYDLAGNITDAVWETPLSPQTAANPARDSLTADTQGKRHYTGTLIRCAGRVRYDHDPQGRVVLRQRLHHSRKPDTWHYTWDTNDQLAEVTDPDGTRWTYRYDPLGRRIGKYRHIPDGHIVEQIDFTWDGVHLAEQVHQPDATQPTGVLVTTWDHHPGTHTAVTQVDRHWLTSTPDTAPDERFHTVITDLVGTPTHLVTPDGRIAWHAHPTLWGATPMAGTDPGANSTVGETKVDCPLRFPGQYYDSETGHHYNNQRYYDPNIGRYLTQDPLGLTGGDNPHQYVNNPTAWIDPLGLMDCRRAKKTAEKVIDRARQGQRREVQPYPGCPKGYHGRLGPQRELEILSAPDAVYSSTGSNGRLIFHQGEDVVITEGPGTRAGQIVTSYGPSGPRGESGASIFGGSPTDPGLPNTADMITGGTVPKPDGGFMPPAVQVWP